MVMISSKAVLEKLGASLDAYRAGDMKTAFAISADVRKEIAMSTPSGELKAALVRNDSLPKHDARAAALAKGPGGLTVNEIDPEQELATRIYSLRKQRHQDLGESMSEAEAAK